MRGEVIVRGVGDLQKDSALRWLKGLDIPPVPIDIACTGPKTIQMAVETGDRISFAVGSAPERIEWAINTANEHLNKIGRDRDSISIGAFVNLVCDEDEQRAINIGRMIAGIPVFAATSCWSSQTLVDSAVAGRKSSADCDWTSPSRPKYGPPSAQGLCRTPRSRLLLVVVCWRGMPQSTVASRV